MNKIQIPPNWAELVKNSQKLVTEERFNMAKTWLFPEADSGNNASIPESSPILQQSGNVGTNATPNIVPRASPTSNILASSQARLPVCEGDNAPSSKNDLEAPKMINMATYGLRRSKLIKNVMNPTNPNNGGPAIMAYTSSVKNESPFNGPCRKKPILEFFSIFCALGSLRTFSTSLSPHFHNKTFHSCKTRVSNDYKRINGIFNDTMNEVCHQVKYFTTSNKAYTYKQMLNEDDFKDFFQAMLEEIEFHKKRDQWTLMERKDLPPGAKNIMDIWSFNRKRYPDGSINKHKSRLCAHGGQQT